MKKVVDVMEKAWKQRFQYVLRSLIFSAFLSLLVLFFSFFLLAYPLEARSAEKAELEKKSDDQEAPAIPVWPRDHVIPSRTCKIVTSADENLTTIADQAIQEFYNAEKRKIITDKRFGCQKAFHSFIGNFCGTHPRKDITSTIRELIPRVFYVPGEVDAKTYDEFIALIDRRESESERSPEFSADYLKKNVLALFSDRFEFESGIPYERYNHFKLKIPNVSPPIDEVQCGYCRADNNLKPIHGPTEWTTMDDGNYLVHYRICFLFRKDKLYDISARIISDFVKTEK